MLPEPTFWLTRVSIPVLIDKNIDNMKQLMMTLPRPMAANSASSSACDANWMFQSSYRNITNAQSIDGTAILNNKDFIGLEVKFKFCFKNTSMKFFLEM